MSSAPPSPSSNRKWYIMAAVASGQFLGTIDGSIVNIALPTLQHELHASFDLVQWVTLGYMLTVTTLILSIGRLADLHGKKALYLAGFAIFTLGSGLCGLANDIGLLIAFRVLQAVGAALVTALGAAILTEAFPPSERGLALGVSGTMVSIGLISGPTAGGLILGVASWHWIFWVNLPVGLIGLLLAARFIPNTRPRGAEGFDLPGALALFVALLTFLLGLTFGQTRGFGDSLPLSLLATAVLTLALFLWLERRSPYPMIDLGLFREVLFSINLLTGFITFVSMGGVVLLMPFYLQNVRGFDPRQAGLLLSVMPLTMGLVAPLAGSLSDRLGVRRITALGLGVLLLGYVAVASLTPTTSAWGYVLRFLPVGLGMGLFQSPNNSAVMGAVPRARLGVASGLLSLSRVTGQTAGMALLGALWAAQVALLGGAGDATTALPALQVAALRATTLGVAVLIAGALGLSLFALWKQAQRDRAAPPATLQERP
jgi:EmrB/QacA subfamily drug resistance transporter